MALRDLWARLTGREKTEEPEAPPAEASPAATAPAPAETRSPPPLPPLTSPAAPGAELVNPEPPVLPEAAGAVAPPETRSPSPFEAGQPPGDLPDVPPEWPAPAAPEMPAPAPLERPAEIPALPPEIPAPAPAEVPAPALPPSQAPAAPPGWQPTPIERPAPGVVPEIAPTPPREVPPAAPPAPPERPAEVPAPETSPNPARDPAPGGFFRSLLPGLGAPPPVAAPPPEPVQEVDEGEEEAARGGFFARLKAGLSRSTAKLTDGLTGLFTKRKLDEEALEELEEALISADLGVAAAGRIVENFRKTRFGKEVSDEEVKEALAEEIAAILTPVAKPLVLDNSKRPHVVLVVGVNGTGKTTTIAKLGQQWASAGKRVTFVAGDTFRAAAVEQLQIWGSRTGCDVVAPAKQGADAAGLAFDALKQAQEKGTDILLVDTAGRLHNKAALMEELRKVVRVMQRLDPSAPHSVLLVLDATTGQNATQQCKVFSELVNVTGLVVTKLDGSAKGGIVVALAQEFGLPVHAVGVGEKAADLRDFSARDFARSLLGVS
jgi:fused signal recognition particle receptor